MVKAKYSTNFKAIVSRLRRLPRLVKGAADSSIKRDLDQVIIEYQTGLVANNFRLKLLNSFTVQQKTEKGMAAPRNPLYGAGEGQQNSLYYALAIRQIKNGWRLYRRRARHHSANMAIRDLLQIHENGAIIRVTDKMRGFLGVMGLHLRKETKVIRIPPRPIVDKAIQRMLRKKKKEEPAKEVRKGINALLKTGNENQLSKMAGYESRNENFN